MKTLLPLLLTSVLTLFISCSGSKKDDNGTIIPPTPPDGRVVYLAGLYDYVKAAVWKNGERQPLSAYENEPGFRFVDNVKSMFVSNDKVYVIGRINFNNNPLEGYYLWVDGVPQKLEFAPNSLFVSGDDVYITSGSGIWKNGTLQTLEGGAGSIFVSGNDVYTDGYINSKSVIQKNGITLYEITDGQFGSIFVSGNDVYAAGRYDSGTLVPGSSNRKWNACIWKNGIRQDLNTGNGSSEALYLAVSGNDVYVVGNNEESAQIGGTALWKNGVIQKLNDATWTRAYSLFVFGNDVYVVGFEVPTCSIVWKNGEIYQRMPGTEISAIFVK